MLVFDEIFLRESISVDTKTLSHTGLEDFSDGISCNQKADCGLDLCLEVWLQII